MYVCGFQPRSWLVYHSKQQDLPLSKLQSMSANKKLNMINKSINFLVGQKNHLSLQDVRDKHVQHLQLMLRIP